MGGCQYKTDQWLTYSPGSPAIRRGPVKGRCYQRIQDFRPKEHPGYQSRTGCVKLRNISFSDLRSEIWFFPAWLLGQKSPLYPGLHNSDR